MALAAIFILVCPINSIAQDANNPMNITPDDYLVEYQWIAGTMPPPYHYEYLIRINSSDQGQIFYWPNYKGKDTPEWTERFSVSPDQLDLLYKKMKDQRLFTEKWQAQEIHIIGGSHEFINVTANMKKIRVPAFVVPEQKERIKGIYTAVRALVPKAIMEKLEAQRQEYMKAYKKR